MTAMEAAEAIAQLVRERFAERGVGMTRSEVASAIGWPQTRNLPGVRAALGAGLIRYDEHTRLVPREEV